MSITNAELTQMKERAGKATDGPWELGYGEFDSETSLYIEGAEVSNTIHRTDAEFIAHAREDVPRLVAEVERLQVENDRLAGLYSQNYVSVTHYKNAVYEKSQEIARLRKALEFYADIDNHKAYKREAGAFHSKATDDNGKLAREALK